MNISHATIIEDYQKTIQAVLTNIFPQAFRRYANLIDLNQPYVLRGGVTDDHGCVTLNVTHVDTKLSSSTGRRPYDRTRAIPQNRLL